MRLLPCLVALTGTWALAGCGSISTGAATSASSQAIERGEHNEEAAEAKREEVAEATKTHELLSDIEAEKREESATAAEAKAKRVEAAALRRATKRASAIETRAKQLEASAKAHVKAEEAAAKAEIAKQREALSKTKQGTQTNGQPAQGSQATTTTTRDHAPGGRDDRRSAENRDRRPAGYGTVMGCETVTMCR